MECTLIVGLRYFQTVVSTKISKILMEEYLPVQALRGESAQSAMHASRRPYEATEASRCQLLIQQHRDVKYLGDRSGMMALEPPAARVPLIERWLSSRYPLRGLLRLNDPYVQRRFQLFSRNT